jgi:Na+/melibiose symporter-like transporter
MDIVQIEEQLPGDVTARDIVVTDGRDEQFAREPAARLSRNRAFIVFWIGQTLSNVGDAIALIALPLLVFAATGSVARMGLVTGISGIGMLAGGVVAGPIADRVDRRRFMIGCDLGRTLVYGAVPVGWWVLGPKLWLLSAVAGLGALLGMCFSVTYVAALPNLVARDQVTEANGRLQATAALANLVGPTLAGVIAARFGPVAALGADACSFAFSALSLACIRFRPVASPPAHAGGWGTELRTGIAFLWQQPVLRTLTFMIGGFSFLTLAALDLFVFHLKHDFGTSDRAVGLVFSIASAGAIVGSLLAAPCRRRWGFGVCYLGGAVVQGVALAAIGVAPALVLVAPLTAAFMLLDLLKGVNSMSLRQQITPDHLLGRVTAAFWTLNSAPGPLGAALLTILAARFGAPAVLVGMGGCFTAIALIGLRTPVNARFPESAQG